MQPFRHVQDLSRDQFLNRVKLRLKIDLVTNPLLILEFSFLLTGCITKAKELYTTIYP